MSILVIEHSDLTGSERLGDRLRDDGHRLQTIRIHQGDELPLNLDEVDAVISCGGPQSPKGSEPWMKQEIKLLKEANKKQLPVLGICLGCQLLAKALGGKVAKSKKPELGWYDLTLTPEGRECVLFGGQPWFGTQFQWHHWEVIELPPDATLLASSEQCSVQAWTVGINSFGIQFHPECNRNTITSWIEDDSRALYDLGFSSDSLESSTDEHFEAYERLTDRFFDAVSQILMPVHNRLHRQRV